MRNLQTIAVLCVISCWLSGADKPEKGKTAMVTGACHCGKITYQVNGPIKESNYCDCRACQKASGAIKAPFIVVARSTFKVTAGKPSQFKSESGIKCDANGVWHFCPNCGTNVFWKGHRGDTVDIFAGTLDDPSVFKPKQ